MAFGLQIYEYNHCWIVLLRAKKSRL